jgi:hypothetical protein
MDTVTITYSFSFLSLESGQTFAARLSRWTLQQEVSSISNIDSHLIHGMITLLVAVMIV